MSRSSPVTERLYYTNAYITRFTARVVEQLTWRDRPAVILDRTAFYPEGGGQPADRGHLNGVPVEDVQVRREDGAVVHVMSTPLTATEVEGVIDWQRRFDHMQQHTAQHILSQAFLRILGAATISVHLGTQAATVDIAHDDLTPEHLHAVEALTNRVIEENREVRVHFVDEATLARWGVRRPPRVQGPIRVVEVVDFDRVPCGGTHVRRTGEIGVLAILRAERYKGAWRVTFVAGARARQDYRRRRELLQEVGHVLSCGENDLLARVQRLLAEAEAARKQLRSLEARFWQLEAQVLWANGEPCGPVRLVSATLESATPHALRHVATALREQGSVIALLGWAGGHPARLLFATSSDVPVAMDNLLREVLTPLGGRGGGRAEWAEGALPDPARVKDALAQARQKVRERLTGA